MHNLFTSMQQPVGKHNVKITYLKKKNYFCVKKNPESSGSQLFLFAPCIYGQLLKFDTHFEILLIIL